MKGADRPMPSRYSRGWIWSLSVALAALVFWVVFMGQAEDSVFGRVPILDEVYYLDQAAIWAQGPFPPDEPFFVSPLYPILIALTGSGQSAPDDRVVPPGHLRGIRLLQVGCWLGILILLRLIAGRVLGRELAPGWKKDLVVWLPAILFALYRPAAVYTVSILLELPLVLLVTVVIYLMTRIADLPGDGRISWGNLGLPLVLGAVIGLAGLLRGTAFLLMVPAIVLVMGMTGNRRTRFIRAFLLLAGGVVVLAPAAIHNSRLAGRMTGPTLNAGVNLFIGNGPEANGFYVAVVPGDWRHDPAGRKFMGEQWGIPTPTLAETDRLWNQEARRSMVTDPLRTVGLWLKKVWLHLQGWEIDQLTPISGWRRAAPILAWLPVPYALLIALGLGGLAVRWSDTRIRWWAAALGIMVAGQSFFFVVSRYRLALVPILCLLAVAGMMEIGRRNRRAMIVSVLAGLLTVPWGLESTRDMWRAQALANEAHRWAEIGEAEESAAARETAESLFRESLAGKAEGPAPWLGLAALLVDRGQRAEAAGILRAGALATSRNLEINQTLLALWLEDGNLKDSLELTGRILAEHPADADTRHNRSVLLTEMNRPEEAMESARALIKAHPQDARGYIDLGIILARSGRREEAVSVFEQGLLVLPGHPLLQRNLDLLTP
jgi:Flp pilus assembly protein TadD